jgi:hypothetical protein
MTMRMMKLDLPEVVPVDRETDLMAVIAVKASLTIRV